MEHHTRLEEQFPDRQDSPFHHLIEYVTKQYLDGDITEEEVREKIDLFIETNWVLAGGDEENFYKRIFTYGD